MERDGLEALLASAGIDGRRLRHALTLVCDTQWWTLGDLVRESATSRRSIEALLREVRLERQGERFRVPLLHTPDYQDLFAVSEPPADPVGHLLPHYEHVVKRMKDLIRQAPAARQALDHVSATAETVVRRALLLGARFWLPGARVLCVGDHDLTSLAVRLVHPECEVTVVDIDERILAYIDAQDLGVSTRWADLRLGLPASAREHDLAVTDPPYTPEGIGLFVARAVEGLKDEGRVLLAYGASERTPMLALKVQQTLSALNLTYEAVYPDFNRYFGAEAIGSAADLYILRPTTKTRPAVAARVDKLATAIYTHGPQSIESAPAAGTRPESGPDFTPDLLVGDWPKDLPQPRARLATWLAKPHASAPSKVAIAVPAGLETALARLLLATRAAHVRVHLAEPPARELPAVPAVYAVTVDGSVLDAVRLPPPSDEAGLVVRRILDNAHGKLANTWREGLIAAAAARGLTLTKNDARALIRMSAPWAESVTVLEAPLHRLESLPTAVAATLASLPD
ncbi:bis-aminopropyl spermidine synthase family protein [Nonomuraea sp. NPDC049152]|uniref:bis-aminopropyl spermidine synthase family protein n=1 Tax=Nonomuraea sp. NPDC049152 TaxID=3154350 RepID=UPI0033DD6047